MCFIHRVWQLQPCVRFTETLTSVRMMEDVVLLHTWWSWGLCSIQHYRYAPFWCYSKSTLVYFLQSKLRCCCSCGVFNQQTKLSFAGDLLVIKSHASRSVQIYTALALFFFSCGRSLSYDPLLSVCSKLLAATLVAILCFCSGRRGGSCKECTARLIDSHFRV